MKRLTIYLTLAAIMLPVMAQEVEVTSLKRLLEGVEGPAYYPVLNGAGDRLLFFNERGELKLHDFTDGVTAVVSRDYVAGNDACFGGDGKVYFVTQQMDDNHLIYRTGNSYDVLTGKSAVLTEPQHGAVRAVPATRGGALRAPAANYSSSDDIGDAAWTEGSRVHIIVGGQERVFAPVDSWAGYLWASLSPDGKRVAFFAAGKGIVVIDLRGQMLAMLGNYEMPCWYNNDYLVAQNAKDDGHQFTSSQIMLLKADGTYQCELTKPASMSMQPTCGGGRIVYTTVDGLLYEMKINIHE
ncbi:MAG: hypothetical protein IKX56_01890 [Muribaculaceae bacterium]|nr:hypothetical protein [Muribaculaceae bacterium]